MSDLRFFTADGKETAAGSEDSVVQYTEDDAKRRGLTFKASTGEAPKATSRDELMRLASLDGSESDKPPKAPVADAPPKVKPKKG